VSAPGDAVPDLPVETRHAPVLVDEVVRWLTPVPPGTWIVDGTVGLGGHAAALLAHAADSRLLGLDRDAETLALAARRLAPFGARCVLRHADFRHLGAEARACGAAPAHAVLLDLGLSSYQLEQSGRGFSFQTDEGLDMRFDRRQPLTAADLVMRTPEPELAHILHEYGEEPAARRIARRLVEARGRAPIRTTRQLADVVASAIPSHRRPRRIHPATRTFQALRIAVNDELGALDETLPAAASLLAPGGRLAVISFHSLEDRRVKQFFRAGGTDAAPLTELTRKPLTPSAEECLRNPRARSAKLRVAERKPAGGPPS
jgi:16S rRNA (cytosine1402-N4)-methyltransferase